MIDNTLPLVVVITGPTGIGKTDISLKLCERYNGEIINCDASQFKKLLNIGTAKIDQTSTNVKHHLIDIIEPNEYYSIADFQIKARELIKDITFRGKIPFLVGGSGLYINSCIYDYDLSANKRDSDSLYSNLTNEELHQILQSVDYETSLTIHCNNRKRVIRAIEIANQGNSISDNKCEFTSIYNTIGFCLNTDRDTLYQRINKRVDVMFDNGWISECEKLINMGYKLNDIKDIGYSYINKYLLGLMSLDEVKDNIRKETRHYAKRQMTWFRNKMDLNFVMMNYDNVDEVINKIGIEIEKSR